MNAAERDLVVRLTPDPTALLEFLDTAAGALITAADTLRAAYPVAEADAPEPWEPKIGDRVTVHYDDHSTASVADGTPGTVEALFPHIRRASIIVDRTTTTNEPDGGWHASYEELRPLVEQPAQVGPVLLVTELLGAQVGRIRINASEAADIVDLVRKRLAQYPADATTAQVYADWFGGAL